MEKDIWFGGYILEDEDYKAIAQMVFNEDKQGLIAYAEKVYAEQGDDEPINKDITFEELWKMIDHDIFWEFDEKNWENLKNDYIAEWEYKNC